MDNKYYIVNEEELKELELMCFEGAVSRMLGYAFTERTDIAKAAVRARPVPEWATHLAGGNVHESYLLVSDRTEYCCDKIEEIKRS